MGVDILTYTHVDQILAEQGKVKGVLTDQGEFSANTIINCAGGWAPGLAAQVGDEIPVFPERHQIMVTEPVAPLGCLLYTSVCRKQYLLLPKILTLLVCHGVCLISGLVLSLTKNAQDLLTVQLLRRPFLVLMAVAVFSFIPLLMYWVNCSGTSLVQRVYLEQNQLYYTGYSGSMEERREFTFTLLQLESYRVGKRAIRIRGQFTKKTNDSYATKKKGPFTKTLWLPRTFTLEQEQALLQFLHDKTDHVH